MTNENLQILLNESHLSPELLSTHIGVSGMTIRRWLKRSSTASIPEQYESAFLIGIQKMVVKGLLNGQTQSAQWAFGIAGPLTCNATLRSLGFDGEIKSQLEDQPAQVVSMLSSMGSRPICKDEVDSKTNEIGVFRKLGREWAERISVLMDVVRNNNLPALEKFVAYGALFYLLLPFDLIPDSIPVVGLLDDFAILGLAAGFYAARAPGSPAVP